MRVDLSTREVYAQALGLARGGEMVILRTPAHAQADLYQRGFDLQHGTVVTRRLRGISYVGDTQIRFVGGETDGLRGLRAHLFVAVPDSRDSENNYMWRFEPHWPGAYVIGPPPPTRFDRLDHIHL